jgi:hypothetical protein
MATLGFLGDARHVAQSSERVAASRVGLVALRGIGQRPGQ